MGYLNKKRYSTWRMVLLLFFVILGIAGLSYASSVTIPNSFTTGTTISSSQMNDNFTAIKTAVDDNDSRITALESGVPVTHRALIAMSDFACMDPANCFARNYNGQWISSTAGQTLILSARLHMPDGAQLVDVWCTFNDNSASDATFRVLMRRINRTGIGFLVLTDPISTTGTSASVVVLQATSNIFVGNWTAANLTADNSFKAFIVQVNVPYDSGFTAGSYNGNNLALHGCYYEYTAP